MDSTSVDQPVSRPAPPRVYHRMSDGEGPLLLALIAGSWLILLAVLWIGSRIITL